MSTVTLQTNDRQHFIVAEDEGGWEGEFVHGRPKGLARADRSAAGAWEHFAWRRAPDGRVAFQAPNGAWLSAQPDGTLIFNRQRDDTWEPAGWEAFAVEPAGEGGISLVTDHGTRVRAVDQGGGELRHDPRDGAGIDETFFPSIPLTGGAGGGGQPGTFAGPVRVDPRGGFMGADGQPRLVQLAHDGGGLSRSFYDPEGQLAVDRITADARFHGRRNWFSLGGGFWNGSGARPNWPQDGKDRSLHPWRYGADVFRAGLVRFLQQGRGLGLGCHLAGGDLTRETVPDRSLLARLVREAIAEAGADLIMPFESLNECRDTGERDADRLAEFARACTEGFDGLVIALSAYTGCDVEAQEVNAERLRYYSRDPANVFAVHAFRGFGWMNKLERLFNVRYEWGAHIGRQSGVNGEPVGVGQRVSATDNMHELNGAYFQLQSLIALACGLIDVHMSGPGVISDEGFEPYGSTPGFFQVCQVRDWLPADAGHFTDVFHGGDNRQFSPRRVFRAIGDTRCEQFLNPHTGRFINIAYGDEAGHVPKNRDCRVEVDQWIEEGHIKGRLLVGQA